jgi:tetratricopeptide (TPR) repeat protein
VLIPYLRQYAGVQDDVAQRRRYMGGYIELAFAFEMGVDQNPELLYALGRRELPNLRTAMAYLLQAGKPEAASLTASWLSHLPDRQGLLRERDRLRQRVDQLLKTSVLAELTPAVYSSEIGRARDELHSGKIRAALTRLTKLLARIEELPDGGMTGPGSYSHAYTLQLIGQCLCEAGQYLDAWQHLQRALDSFNAQLEQEPGNPILHTAHANLLGDLGHATIAGASVRALLLLRTSASSSISNSRLLSQMLSLPLTGTPRREQRS